MESERCVVDSSNVDIAIGEKDAHTLVLMRHDHYLVEGFARSVNEEDFRTMHGICQEA